MFFHFGACIWIAIGFPKEADEKTWFLEIPGLDYVYGINELQNGNFEVYLDGFFYIAQTLSRVGYGAFTGHSNREYMFSLFLLIIGLFVFSFLFEKTQSIVRMFNETERRESQQVLIHPFLLFI